MNCDYGISKIIKSKTLTAGKIMLCQLQNSSTYAVLVFDNNDKLIDSICNICVDGVKSPMYHELNKEYRIRLQKLMKKETF